jgi:hypothetical protein
MAAHTSFTRRGLAFTAGILAVILVGVAAVGAQQGLVQTDQRLNQVADFGGDALYCIDTNQSPTNDTKTWDHFELLSGTGQVLWTLPRTTVEEGLGMIKYGTPPVLLGSGQGTFGAINLYGNANADGTPFFIFTGFDDHYKPNQIQFLGCTPVGSALPAPTATASIT